MVAAVMQVTVSLNDRLPDAECLKYASEGQTDRMYHKPADEVTASEGPTECTNKPTRSLSDEFLNGLMK